MLSLCHFFWFLVPHVKEQNKIVKKTDSVRITQYTTKKYCKHSIRWACRKVHPRSPDTIKLSSEALFHSSMALSPWGLNAACPANIVFSNIAYNSAMLIIQTCDGHFNIILCNKKLGDIIFC